MHTRSRLLGLLTAMVVALGLLAPVSAHAALGALITVTGHVSLGTSGTSPGAGDVVVTFDPSSSALSEVTATTDASGDYSIQVMSSEYYVISYEYVGTAGYYAERWYPNYTEPTVWFVENGPQVYNITLQTVVPVSGSVFVGDGTTSAADTGYVTWDKYESGTWRRSSTPAVRTAADGTFSAFLLPGSYKFVFGTSQPGYQQWYGESVQVGPAPVTGITGVIPPKGRVTGHVTVDGRAATAGEVMVFYQNCAPNGSCTNASHPAAPIPTDASGNYSIADLWDGRYKVTFTYRDSSYQVNSTVMFAIDSTGRDRVYDATMLESISMSGTVYLGDTSRTAGAGEVSVQLKRSGTVVRTVLTDANGRYGASGLESGYYTYTFTYLGTGNYRGIVTPTLGYAALFSNTLGPDATLPLQNGISGTVRDTGGNPLQGVSIYAHGTRAVPLNYNSAWYVLATTDVNGEYEIWDIPDSDIKVRFSGGNADVNFGTQEWPLRHKGLGEPIHLAGGGMHVGVDATLAEEGSILVGIDAPSLAPGDYGPNVSVSYHVFDDIHDEWAPGADSSGFSSADDVYEFGNLTEGYYYVTVTYAGPKGFDSSSSPIFEVTPGSVDAWVAEISPANLMDCFEDPSLPMACRIGGQDRFNVSAKISELGFDPGVDVVYIANGLNYPDALSAAPAASLEGGPLLLVTPTEIPAPILAEIRRLHPRKIMVVGGPGSVSPAVFTQLEALAGEEIVRLGGIDRYAASRAVAEYAFGGPDGPGADVAYITTGRNFPDALSAGGAAATQFAPVITVDGQATEIDDETRELLIALGVDTVKIAGGPGSVSQALVDSIDAIPNIDVIRLWGQDRYEASGDINRDAFDTADVVFLSVGTNYPDALSGGALAGAFGAPLYVIPRTCIPSYVLDDIQSFGASTVIVLGGPGSVAQSVLDFAEC